MFESENTEGVRYKAMGLLCLITKEALGCVYRYAFIDDIVNFQKSNGTNLYLNHSGRTFNKSLVSCIFT